MTAVRSDAAEVPGSPATDVDGIASLTDLLSFLRQYDIERVAAALAGVFEGDVETRPTFSSSWVAPPPPPAHPRPPPPARPPRAPRPPPPRTWTGSRP